MINWNGELEYSGTPGSAQKNIRYLGDFKQQNKRYAVVIITWDDGWESITTAEYDTGIIDISLNTCIRNKKKKYVRYFNVYTNGPGSTLFNTEEQAGCSLSNTFHFIRTQKIEVEV
jgi:hypothetical protein